MAVTALEYFGFSYFLQLNLEIFETAAINQIQVGGRSHGCLIEDAAALPVPHILTHPRFGVDRLMHMPRG